MRSKSSLQLVTAARDEGLHVLVYTGTMNDIAYLWMEDIFLFLKTAYGTEVS